MFITENRGLQLPRHFRPFLKDFPYRLQRKTKIGQKSTKNDQIMKIALGPVFYPPKPQLKLCGIVFDLFVAKFQFCTEFLKENFPIRF